ncbi:MAG: DNA gyrase inhibitor YacG [Methylophilaceae bacterium]
MGISRIISVSLEYRKGNPFRSFCSERCKLVDMG